MASRSKGRRKGPKSKTPLTAKSANLEEEKIPNRPNQNAATGSETRLNSVNSALKAAKIDASIVSGQTADQTVENNSRYKPLDKTCRHCDKVCVEVQGLVSENLVCKACKNWSHMACEKLDRNSLIETKKKSTFVCESCKDIDASNSEFEANTDSELSMNTQDRYRAEHDSEIDEDDDAINESNESSIEDENKMLEEGVDVLKSTATADSNEVHVLKSTDTSNNDGIHILNSKTVNNKGQPESSESKGIVNAEKEMEIDEPLKDIEQKGPNSNTKVKTVQNSNKGHNGHSETKTGKTSKESKNHIDENQLDNKMD